MADKYWEENSILNHYNKNTPPREIFQAVCDSIGKYYKYKGFKYSKSTPKITRKTRDYKLEIRFYSTGSNYAGGYVNLEINSNFYSLELAKLNKSKNRSKGLLTTMITPLSKQLKGNYKNGTRIVHLISGEINEHHNENIEIKELRFNRNIDIHGINEILFQKKINFIDTKIIDWYDKFLDPLALLDLLEEASFKSKSGLKSTEFLNYIDLKYPNLKEKISEILNT